ncbi:MAG: YajD family HNH nuclease [Desulfobulbaceae bacterium]|nr:YajD family HNH nuclease [Desulfobulbaceae bacterium]
MPTHKTHPGGTPIGNQPLGEEQHTLQLRKQGYRERALKIFPWVCAKCGREFAGKKLAELTVHHKDHNHDNNPTDGSNWELLCLYCHDNEHSRSLESEWQNSQDRSRESSTTVTHNPFANIKALLTKNDYKEEHR